MRAQVTGAPADPSLVHASTHAATPQGPSAARLIEETLELPTMPEVASRVIAIASSEHATAAKIAEVIEADSGISAQLLRVANSAFYGFQRQVRTLQQAVVMIGVTELRHLVLATSTRNLFRWSGPIERKLWEHSVAVAVGARVIATKARAEHRDEAFLAGQLHDVGKLILADRDPARFAGVVKRMQAGATDDCAAEHAEFGFTHLDVGALLARRWNLPRSIEAATFLHHDLDLAATVEPGALDLVATVTAADLVACRLGACVAEARAEGDDTNDALRDALTALGAPELDVDELIEEVRGRFDAERSLFGA